MFSFCWEETDDPLLVQTPCEIQRRKRASLEEGPEPGTVQSKGGRIYLGRERRDFFLMSLKS